MKKFFTLLLALLCCANVAQAQDTPELNYRHFSLIPVLHEGRVKPVDSYARITLRNFSGHENVRGHTALDWLAEVLFDPVNAVETPTFEIISPTAKERLGLDKNKTLFSLSELTQGLTNHGTELESLTNADPETLTPEQNTLLDLYLKVEIYNQLLRSFSAFMPLNVKIPKAYDTGKAEYSYADFVASEQAIVTKAAQLAKKKGTDLSKFTDDERALVELGFALQEIRARGNDNTIFKIVQHKGQFLTPWQYLLEGGDPAPWLNLVAAYRAGDDKAWRAAAKTIKGKTPLPLKLEKGYNATDPFDSAMGFYFLGLVILAAEIYRKSRRMLFPFICIGAGLALHVAGLIVRMIILERPPVATLYESLLFVSLVCAASGLALYFRRKSTTSLFAGPGSAAFLLFISPFLLQQGESMEMLVAVLNTSFWLGTHVLCITAGYGVCILTAVLAHAWFVLRIKDAPPEKLKLIEDSVYKFSLVALLLTGVGTILGGIWADQSWGRFWGWDPKENGALIIVLWLVWAQHGRIGNRLNTAGFIAACAFLNVVVALAWFGVNLLSVGLHSYGFISGIAIGLALFCAVEITIIAALWRLHVEKTKSAVA